MSAALESVPRGDAELAEVTNLESAVGDCSRWTPNTVEPPR